MEKIQNQMLSALLHEYKRAVIDLKIILEMLSNEEFVQIRDSETKDEDCRSIQTIVFHIIQSGYTYANYLNSVTENLWKEYNQPVDSAQTAIHEIDLMLDFTEKVLRSIGHYPLKEIESWRYDTSWQATYDIEQLLEHAIVHILRHRYQIECFFTAH